MFVRILSVGVLIVALSACGHSPSSMFYVLDDSPLPSRSLTLENTDTVVIGVEDVSIPTYLDRPQIVIRGEEEETLEVAEFHRWAEHLGDVLPRVIGDAVSERAGYPLAKPATLNKDVFSYRLYIEIMRFDARMDGAAMLDAWWTITDASGDVLYRTRSVLVEPVGDSYSDIVKSERFLARKLGFEIADFYTKNLKNIKKKGSK